MKGTIRTLLVAVAAVLLVAGGTALAAVYKDFSEFRLIRHTNLRGPSNYTASADVDKADLHTYQFFKVDTTDGAVDLDFADDADLDPADIGSSWRFCVGIGGTNALTVTAGATGVTNLKLVDADGTTCEDVGDCIVVTAYATSSATAVTQCAD